MIGTDKDWQNLVKNIANGSANRREPILEAAGYLWDSFNWDRLSETPCGRFLRETSVLNDCPDLNLRAMYRKQVLESQE